ncbi:MAG: hypothetical protein CMF38_00665 [Legionellaceae bacterium]|nr:hypothetical protein [Legionellaceae bacterium]HCA89607.1 hypothetical protein [Legionellales bacterium]|tara:strand:- start:262 stop:849 length:588 start_codon:yes stop_codon:yes gene_type:complete
MKHCIRWLILGSVLVLSGCVTKPPHQVDDACLIFKQYPRWYKEVQKVERRWHVPISVQMAIIHQESKFNGRAKPPRQKIFWIIPGRRPSTAYGYTQALSTTWAVYKRSTGYLFSSRIDFSDAVDFIGWYAHEAHRRAGIMPSDAYSLYLAYHEGIGGFQQKTYLTKPWLLAVAKKVKVRAAIYAGQLEHCTYGYK